MIADGAGVLVILLNLAACDLEAFAVVPEDINNRVLQYRHVYLPLVTYLTLNHHAGF